MDGAHIHQTLVDELDALHASVEASDDEIDDLKVRIAVLESGSPPPDPDPDPPPDPDPDPEPDWQTVWGTDFSNGYGAYLVSNPYSNSGSGSGTLVDAPGSRNGRAVRAALSSSGDGSAVRLRHDGKTIKVPGFSGGDNLPPVSKYGCWFYLPRHYRLGPGDGSGNADTWNIFQWKQTWPQGSGYTRRMVQSVRLRDFGNDYAFTVDSRVHDDGTWSDDKDAYYSEDSIRVGAEEWFHVEAIKVFSPSQAEGGIKLVINGQEAFDRRFVTELRDGQWADYGDWRRQWTDGNYPSAQTTPSDPVIFLSGLTIGIPV